jgi:dethiobiotin synthetase
MPRYLIIGTDTDCGKTYVTCQMLKHLENTLAIKPVQSGGTDDSNALAQHQPHWDGEVSHWSFEPAIAPHLAAKKAGETITFDALDVFCDTNNYPGNATLLIETTGGLMCPLNANQTWLDYAVHSQIPVLFVVGLRLGCLNHALLTAHALTTHHIACVGWIANIVDPAMTALEENLDTLKQTLPYPHLATLPFHGTMPSYFSLNK